MSENFADLQLKFDFADTDNTELHGGRQIAAPVDDSLVEDDEEESSSQEDSETPEIPRFPFSPSLSLPGDAAETAADEPGPSGDGLPSPDFTDNLSCEPEPSERDIPQDPELFEEESEDLPSQETAPATEPGRSQELYEFEEPQPIPQAQTSDGKLPETDSPAPEAAGGTEKPQESKPEESLRQRFVYSEFARKEEETMPNPTPIPTPTTTPISETAPATPQRRESVSRAPLFFQRELQRAALAWLASGFPTAAAIRVPTRLTKFRADAAAFWSTPGRNRLLQPEHTVLVEARATRSSCWPECSGSEEIVPQLRLEQEKRQEIEAEIRRREPHLRDSAVLFPEIEYWNYAGTRNPEYKFCLRRIREYERALYRGSRFERIRRANVANELYLAVPEGMIHPNELAEGWGLLYVARNLSVKVVRKALFRECPQENMLHLSQNIAASSLSDVLFAHGVYLSSNGRVSFRRPPRRRRLEHFL